MTIKRFKELLSSSYKSNDTEEWFDTVFNRPAGLIIALMGAKVGMHPNTVTAISMVLGVAAGVMFYFPDLTHNIIGVILLVLANFCDSADGQLARLTNQRSLIGRMLDGVSSDVWFYPIYTALALRMMDMNIPFTDMQWGWWSFALCALAGFGGHSRQCLLADYYRQIHLFFLLGKKGSELDDYKSQMEIYNSFPKKGHFWDRAFYYNYADYCKRQEQRTPAFQEFYRRLRERYPNTEDIPQTLRDDFRAGSLPLMKYTNLLTFNLRAAALYTACLINIPYLYPMFEITVMALMWWHMHSSHERLCRQMTEKYFA